MSTETPFDGQAFIARADAFDAKTIADALALAGAVSADETRAVIATLPGFTGVEVSDDRLRTVALGILSGYVGQIAGMYAREKNRAADLQAKLTAVKARVTGPPFAEGDDVHYAGDLPEDVEPDGRVIGAVPDASGDWIMTVEFPGGSLGTLRQDILASELAHA